MLLYAGIPLIAVTPEMEEAIESRFSISDIYPWEHEYAYVGRGGFGLAAKRWHDRPLHLGTLLWPTGASRWAEGIFLASQEQVDSIQAAVDSLSPAPLILSDGPNTVETLLTLLPPRQLLGIPGLEGLWLLPLVDQRYFWWTRKTGDFEVGQDTPWGAVLDQLAGLLGVGLEIDPISLNYALAPSNLTAVGEPVPPLLDYVAQCVGQRIVVHWNGTVASLGWESAQAIQGTDLANVSNPLMAGPGADPADNPRIIPSQINVSFPLPFPPSGANTGELITIPVASLDLGFPASNGESRDLSHPFMGATEGDYGPVAQQYALDYIQWLLPGLDASYFGIVPWSPSGFEDRVEWTYRRDEVSTSLKEFSPVEGDTTPARQWRDQVAIRDRDFDDPTEPTENLVFPLYTLYANNQVTEQDGVGTYSTKYEFGRIQMIPHYADTESVCKLDWQGIMVKHDECLPSLPPTPPTPCPGGFRTIGSGGGTPGTRTMNMPGGCGPGFTRPVGGGGGNPPRTGITRTGGGGTRTGFTRPGGGGGGPPSRTGFTRPGGTRTIHSGGGGGSRTIKGIVPARTQLGDSGATTPGGGSFTQVGSLILSPEGTPIAQLGGPLPITGPSATSGGSNSPGGGSGGGIIVPSGCLIIPPLSPPPPPMPTCESAGGQATAYGPEPDLKFVDTAFIQWDIQDDKQNRQITITPVFNPPPDTDPSCPIIICPPPIIPPIPPGGNPPGGGPPCPSQPPILPPPQYVTWLATWNANQPQNLTDPTLGIIALNDLGATLFGRIRFYAPSPNGYTFLGWQGFYCFSEACSSGGGAGQYPAPDITFTSVPNPDLDICVHDQQTTPGSPAMHFVNFQTKGYTGSIRLVKDSVFSQGSCSVVNTYITLKYTDGLLKYVLNG